MANNRPIFSRLAGLETEYALRFRPNLDAERRPSRYELYQHLVAALRLRLLTVGARHLKDGVFTASGGAVWFEAERPASGGGLVEGATPECRGPRQLLAHQRAQDRRLAEAAAESQAPGRLTLIKNDRDSRGNIYGAQENYEAAFADGWRLGLWRVGLLLLLPLLLVVWLGFVVLIVFTILYFATAELLYRSFRSQVRQPKRLAALLLGAEQAEGVALGFPGPRWFEWLSNNAIRLTTAPLALGLFLLLWATAFRRQRRGLLPFLLTRPVIAGAGMIDGEGRFHLSDKAPAMNCVLGYGGLVRDRPIFYCGHLLKSLCVETIFNPHGWLDLFSARQRLQINLGDSNMAETAEYLRIGATMLVLDAIEAGELPPILRVRRPIAGLRRICADPTLGAKIHFAGGGEATALEVQRAYLLACRRFVQRRPEAPDEAHEILRLWEETLDSLDRLAAGGEPGPELIGTVDWVAKKVLLDQAGAEASWSERKKIDIRYHELSPQGYFARLEKAGVVRHLLAEEEIERAMRTPPPGTPATMRAHYIREFAAEGGVEVNWNVVVIADEHGVRKIRLRDPQAAAEPAGAGRGQHHFDHGPRNE